MRVKCRKCGAILKVPSDALGKSVRCPKCGHVFNLEILESAEGVPNGQEPFSAGPASALEELAKVTDGSARRSRTRAKSAYSRKSHKVVGKTVAPPKLKRNTLKMVCLSMCGMLLIGWVLPWFGAGHGGLSANISGSKIAYVTVRLVFKACTKSTNWKNEQLVDPMRNAMHKNHKSSGDASLGIGLLFMLLGTIVYGIGALLACILAVKCLSTWLVTKTLIGSCVTMAGAITFLVGWIIVSWSTPIETDMMMTAGNVGPTIWFYLVLAISVASVVVGTKA